MKKSRFCCGSFLFHNNTEVIAERRSQNEKNTTIAMRPYIMANDDRDYTDTIKFQKKKET